MENPALYYKNLALLSKSNPLLASRLENVDCSLVQFCYTHIGELNLADTSEQKPFYLHQPAGAAWEAGQWAKILPLDKTDVLFVYGLGLGYCYFPLAQWLKENKKRYLVFIEDDLRVLRRFLETQKSTQLLKNKQVVICGAPFLRQKDYAWKDLCKDLPEIFWAFCRSRGQVSALPAYFFSRFNFFDTLAAQWYAALGRSRRRLTEFLGPTINPIFCNFYANLPYIWQAVPAHALFGELSSIPAILAGAGPSLEKQLPLLKLQKNKALLLAGGSGMNAVTHAGIMPHAGAAIDPTATQANRQLTSFAFEVPVFYQNRYFAEAFSHLHGPRLYVCGSGDFPLGSWFENTLGIASSQEIIRGVSSSNFLLEIASLLRCDPIVLVGTDLAYTHGARYAAGIRSHPTDQAIQKHLPTTDRDGLVVPGLDGQEVVTKMEWCLEAMCMTDFKERNPQLSFFNATEGGMPIGQVENVAFKKVTEEFLTRPSDIQGIMHGAIQNAAAKMSLDESQVMDAIGVWQSSLHSSLDYIKKLRESLKSNKGCLLKGEDLPFGPYSGQAALWEAELHQEIAYEHLLRILDLVFDTLHKRIFQELAFFRTARQKLLKQLALEGARLRSLEKHARSHLRMLSKGLAAYQKFQRALKRRGAAVKENPALAAANYLSENGTFVIDESALDLHVKTKFLPEKVPAHLLSRLGQQSGAAAIIGEKGGKAWGQALYFYPSGRIKIDSYYEDGYLHGPWSYFAESGLLLARSWFMHGQRQGRSCYNYFDGQLYTMQTYRHGLPHGQWRYYYRDGTLKTVEEYVDGLLHGIVQLYYPNGYLKKELHFMQGKLHGAERMWSVNGALIFESS